MAKADLSRDYNNRDFIPDAGRYIARWQDEGQAWREVEAALGRARLNDAYGPAPRQAMDIFMPAGPAEGVVMFVHGGYWRDFDRGYWAHFSAGATARGWAVAMPSYTLAPEARIGAITGEIARALCHAAARIAGPIILVGHSAGGHLVTRMNCADVALPADIAARLTRIVAISPVSDLRPLLQTDINADLRLDPAEARQQSPVLHRDRRGVPTVVWVGAEERPAFLDQAEWLVAAWDEADLHVEAGRHHFDIIDGLATAGSPLMNAILASGQV